MSDEQRNQVVKMLAIACELTGTNLSEAAAKFMVEELSGEPFQMVIRALQRCSRECRNRITLSEVMARIEEERERDGADRRAALMRDETQLRLRALEAGIPWEAGKEEVRRLLSRLALPAPDPAKDRERARNLANAKHWSDTEKD